MSSLRPESDKLHSLGTETIRWKNIFIENVDADGQIKVENTNSEQNALIVSGNVSINIGDISIWDSSVEPKEEYKVLEKLKELQNNSGNIDDTNLMHLSSSNGENEDILTLKTFKGGLVLDTSGSKTYTITPSGSIPSGSNDGSIPTTYWVNEKLKDFTIENATSALAGKVRLALPENISSAVDIIGDNPLVVQPSQMVDYVSSSFGSIAGGLNYKGAVEVILDQETEEYYINPPIYDSLQGDFWYVKLGGVITIAEEEIELNNNDILIFKNDADGVDNLDISDFDIITNSLSFQQVKNLLVSGNLSSETYYAKNLFSKGIVIDETNFSPLTPATYLTSSQILKNYGTNTAISGSSYNFVSSSIVTVPTISFDTPIPTVNNQKTALNVESLIDYLNKYLSINSLSDVSTSGDYSPTNGQVLTWETNENLNQWIPKTINLTTNIDSLTDVTITNASNNQILVYSSASNSWINQNNTLQDANLAYISSSSSQTFVQENIFSNGLRMTKEYNGTNWITWPIDVKDQNLSNTTYSNILFHSGSFNKNVPATREWSARRSLRRIKNEGVLAADIDLQGKYDILGYSDSENNYPYYNDILWIFRSQGVGQSPIKKITLPNISNNSANPAFIKQGFTLEIKNIPVSGWLTSSPENYVINISPTAGQAIDAEVNATIQLVPFASLTFVISDSTELGWVII